MRYLTGRFYTDAQCPHKVFATKITLGPKNQNEANQSGKPCRKGNAHSKNDHQEETAGHPKADINRLHQSFPSNASASSRACSAMDRLSGTATGASSPR